MNRGRGIIVVRVKRPPVHHGLHSDRRAGFGGLAAEIALCKENLRDQGAGAGLRNVSGGVRGPAKGRIEISTLKSIYAEEKRVSAICRSNGLIGSAPSDTFNNTFGPP